MRHHVIIVMWQLLIIVAWTEWKIYSDHIWPDMTNVATMKKICSQILWIEKRSLKIHPIWGAITSINKSGYICLSTVTSLKVKVWRKFVLSRFIGRQPDSHLVFQTLWPGLCNFHFPAQKEAFRPKNIASKFSLISTVQPVPLFSCLCTRNCHAFDSAST